MAHHTRVFKKKHRQVKLAALTGRWVAAYLRANELVDIACTAGELVDAQLVLDDIEDYCESWGIEYVSSPN